MSRHAMSHHSPCAPPTAPEGDAGAARRALVLTLGVVVAAACGGERGAERSSEPPTQQGAPAPPGSGAATRPGIRFDPAAVGPGAAVGGLLLDSITVRRAHDSTLVGSARFRGELTLRGRTMSHPESDAREVCFEADSASAARMPRWAGDERRPWFCFVNTAEAARRLAPPRVVRAAAVVVDRFTIHRGLSDEVNSARLVRVVALTADSADRVRVAPNECYVTDRSILARRPNSVAPGPAGLRGWVQLERDAAADSGPALLVDSDGVSLGAAWRRGPGDSLLVVGFDDFLRVELRLALRDGGATGSASAHSDAALERDSAGKPRDFRRKWPLVARRMPCLGAPRPARRAPG